MGQIFKRLVNVSGSRNTTLLMLNCELFFKVFFYAISVNIPWCISLTGFWPSSTLNHWKNLCQYCQLLNSLRSLTFYWSERGTYTGTWLISLMDYWSLYPNEKNALLLFGVFFEEKNSIEKISCLPNIISHLLKNAKMPEKAAV